MQTSAKSRLLAALRATHARVAYCLQSHGADSLFGDFVYIYRVYLHPAGCRGCGRYLGSVRESRATGLWFVTSFNRRYISESVYEILDGAREWGGDGLEHETRYSAVLDLCRCLRPCYLEKYKYIRVEP